tara:strand:- start:532 stop:1065 length:534 start_codon:yes stop_codon:yes gene_type:complete
MACPLALGMSRDCSDSTGGVQEILISERDNITAFTQASMEVSAITQFATTKFYRYELKKEVGSLTSTITIDPAKGTSFYDNVVAFTINKMTAAKSNELRLMILGRLVVLAKDGNDVWWSIGLQGTSGADGFAEGTSLVGQTGTAFGDANSYDISISDKQKDSPFVVAASVVAGLDIV